MNIMSKENTTLSENKLCDSEASCSVSSCQHSPKNLEQWKDTLCGNHTGQLHVHCGCTPTFSIHPLPNDSLLQGLWVEALGLAVEQIDNQIQVCSMHFVEGKPTESNPIPLIQKDTSISEKSFQESILMPDELLIRSTLTQEKPLPLKPCETPEEPLLDYVITPTKALQEHVVTPKSLPKEDAISGPSQDATQASSFSWDLKTQDTSLPIPLSHSIKRPVCGMEDDTSTSKKHCGVTKKEDEAVNPVPKTLPTRPVRYKYRASSPTIMTTRGKSQKDTLELNRPINEGADIEASPPDHQSVEGQRKRNGTSCVVPGCRITGWSNPDIKWYRIPKDERLRQIWLTHIGRADFDPKEYHRICSTHFAGGRKTFDSIIPTIGVPTTSKESEANATPSPQLKNSSVANKNSFLVNKPWYSRWPIAGNNTGSMCCIPGCKSTRRRNLALKYYRFPKEGNLRQQWLSSIGLRNFMPRDNSRVCSAHFEGGVRSDTDSVPTVFSTDTIALRNIQLYDEQHQSKQEAKDTKNLSVTQDFTKKIKQAAPHKVTKSSPKTYGNYCCVTGCNSKWISNSNLSFYRIPGKSKYELRKQWVEAIGAHNITSSESRICSLHFQGGRKTEDNLVPTIFPETHDQTDAEITFKKQFNSEYMNDWEKQGQLSCTPQSNIETLLQASDILSQREAETSRTTPTSSTSLGDGSMHLPPETPKGSSCMVPGCGNTRSNSKGRLRWYRVPKDVTQRRLWLKAIGWPNAVPTDTTRICSAHFVEGIFRKKGDKAVPTIFPPKPKNWHETHPQVIDGIKAEITWETPDVVYSSPGHSPSTNPSSPRGGSPRGDQQQNVLPFVTRNHFEAHPYGPTMLRPEMFERSPKQQGLGESRGVTCCIARCHNNTKRTPGLRWYRIPADTGVRQCWIDFICIGRPDFNPKNHHRVCSAHFKGGMKFSKTSIPSIYDEPNNRRFLPPPNYQRPLPPQEDRVNQVTEQSQERQSYTQELPGQLLDNQEVNKKTHLKSGSQSRQRWQRPISNDEGSGGETPMDLSKSSTQRKENTILPIRERSILPLTHREKQEQVVKKESESTIDLSQELGSVPYNGVYIDLQGMKVALNNDLLTGNTLLTEMQDLTPGMIESRKRIGGGGQCFVPGCNNTRRHNPGLKWYRIPKDPDLRTLWLDNISRPDAEPKPHNRICSDHFEGGYKQFNTSLPTVEKWSDTSRHLYTGRKVVDTCSSTVGSTLLAADSNPIGVDVSDTKVAPTVAVMQSLADSLTALAKHTDLPNCPVATHLEDITTPQISSSDHEYHPLTCDSLTTKNIANPSLLLETSISKTSSASSSVATYSMSSPEECSIISPFKVDTDLPESGTRIDCNDPGRDDLTSQNTIVSEASGLEVGSTCTPIYTSPSKHRDRQRSYSSCQEHPMESSVSSGNLEFTDTSLITIAGGSLPELTSKSMEPVNQVAPENLAGNDTNSTEKDLELLDGAVNQECQQNQKAKYLDGLVQSMCEELRLKDQRLKEKDHDLMSCRQKLEEKVAECERLKRKCLMMSVRLSSFRKLAQTDL